MRASRHGAIMPMIAGMIITVIVLALLPTAGIQAIGAVSHPNDVFTEVYQNASPSVVAIMVENESGRGNGSGFVIDKEGHIVTNAHVVDEAGDIVVSFLDDTIVRGDLVGIDKASDIAVIKVDLPADQLMPIPFADSDELISRPYGAGYWQPFRAGLDIDLGHHQRA